ncbi:MAG TPA: leucyl aminopeptidase [Polyangiaceae bacterium]|nr:leucyl aminopeptidase [Polyangiaceae bacterium]
MPLSVSLASDPLAEAVDTLVVSAFASEVAAHPTLLALDHALGGALLAHIKAEEFEAKFEQTLEVPLLAKLVPGKLKARKLVLVGAGAVQELNPARLRSLIAGAIRGCSNAKSLAFVLPGAELDLRVVGEAIGLGSYRFTKYFTGDRRPKRELAKVSVCVPGAKPTAEAKRQLARGVELAQCVAIARDAVNEPPNVMNPEGMAALARKIAQTHKFKIKVLDKKGILAAGMNLHYAVGQGSANEPRFIHLSYVPKRRKKKLVFVGKGLTFDSGGLCIKPAAGMGEMKSDMGGAAAVLGLMAAVGVLRPDVEVHGIVGAAENMPDGEAYRPADVFTSLDGKTVEIVNTDAEGRLVLADALCYAARLEPDVIVDAATLTGAALVALGKTCSAFYTADDDLAHGLEAAARTAGESFWRMPLIDELAEQLKSDVADLKHTADRWGGSITAALFLREFVGKVPWIHCDVAGPVLSDRSRGVVPKGGTGHPVLTFVSFVENLAR